MQMGLIFIKSYINGFMQECNKFAPALALLHTCTEAWIYPFIYTVKCRYNAVFGVQEIDRVIAVTAL